MSDFSQGFAALPTEQTQAATTFRDQFKYQQKYNNARNDYILTLCCDELGIVLQADLPQEFTFDVQTRYEDTYAQGINDMVPSAISNFTRAIGLNLTTQALTAQLWQGSSEIQFTLPLIFQAERDERQEVIKRLMQLMYLTLPREEEAGGLLSAPGPHIDFEKFKRNFQSGSPAVSTIKNEYKRVGDSISAAIEKNKGTLSSGLSGWVDTGFDIGTQVRTSGDAVAKTVSAAIVSSIKNNIQLYIGRYMFFPSVVITDVQQTHHTLPVEQTGNVQRVEVTVTFKTFYLPTQRDIVNMFPNSGAAGDEIARLVRTGAAPNSSD